MQAPEVTLPSGAPEISVVVAHLNQPEPLRLLLASLFAQDFDMGRAEVIVVDNGSRALPREVIAAFPGVVLAEEAQPGPGHARNRGVGLSRAPLVAFTDSDCRVAPDWLAVILERFDDPSLEILGGEISMTTEVPGDPNPAEAFDCVYGYDQRDYIERQGFSVTANMAARRELFEVVGPFAGIEIAEDMDWGQRAAALGHVTRYEPTMVVFHPARRSMAELRAKWARNVSHHYRMRARGAAGRVRWVLTALAMAVSAPAEIPRLMTTDRLPSFRARVRAFRGLASLRAWRAWAMLAAISGDHARAGNLRWNRG
jgi:glycosyltransferase involved in cell wall biosynthesis